MACSRSYLTNEENLKYNIKICVHALHGYICRWHHVELKLTKGHTIISSYNAYIV